MMDEGSLVITLVIDKIGTILGEPQISTFGLLDSDDDKSELIQRIRDSVAALSSEDVTFNARIDQAVRTAIRKFLDEFYGKHPLIDVHLVRV